MPMPGPAPVVVGVNGTSSGLAAARLGAREAMARGQPLRILHVFAWPGSRSFDDAPDWATARHQAGRIVDEAVATASRTAPGVQVEGLLMDGLPVRALLRQSRTAGLIVLGDDDLALSPRLPADSVLVQTVSRARCPVVVARGNRPPAGPLLTAVDGSPSSMLALRMAAAESRRRDIPVEVAHVVGREDEREAGRRLLESALAAVPELTDARPRLLVGDAAPILIHASHRARMMIVGPRGTSGGSLLGEVAQQLLRRCACPTVFVHGNPAGESSTAGTVPSAGALMS
jgi:nucleotide-binding universal stress UspA family protein